VSVATTAPAKPTHEITYVDLYRRWEQSNWRAYEIDFSQDREGWQSLNEIQRRSGLWTYSMFFYGEDSVTDNLSPYIDAAPTEEQSYFLATQQVDEARHAIFFNRFFKEVIGAPGDTIADGLASTLPELGWGYRYIFDRLDRMGDELRADHSLPKFAQAITLYHMVVEATLAQPGQHFIEDFFVKAGTLPGFSAGMKNVSRDEQRHIAFGVKALSDMFADPDQGEECKAAAVEILREVIPYALGVFVPPGWDERYVTEYGFSLQDIYAFGIRSIRAKWRATGYPIEEMPGDVFPFDYSQPEEEIAANQITLLKAGVLGEPNGRPDSSPDIQRRFFDIVARSVNREALNGHPVTIQWRFKDAEPWHVDIDNGSSVAAPGEAKKANLTLKTTWADFIDVAVRGTDPRRAALRGKIRPRGSLRLLAKMPKIFPQRDPIV
jgi:ribonucleotide reductase small subunit/alkyl sulfatase-like protein